MGREVWKKLKWAESVLEYKLALLRFVFVNESSWEVDLENQLVEERLLLWEIKPSPGWTHLSVAVNW